MALHSAAMPLVEVAANGSDEAGRRLLWAGADADRTALHLAAEGGWAETVRLLLGNGSDPIKYAKLA